MNYFIRGLVSLWLLVSLHAASFEEAAQLTKQGSWDAAILNYETLLKNHGPSASIYYNLGLCYQQKADHGRAVLAYERARAITPRAADVRKNLAQLREQASLPDDRMLPVGIPTFVAWFSRSEWTFVFLLGLLLLVAATTACSFSTQKKIRDISVSVIIGSIIISASTAWITVARKSEDNWAVVLSADQALLLSPFASAEKISPVPPGYLIQIESEKGGYVYAKRPTSETRGWLRRDSLERITPQ